MSTVFQVPCPDCGQQMLVEADGGLECATLARASSPTTPTPS
jgi:hypothetical protein